MMSMNYKNGLHSTTTLECSSGSLTLVETNTSVPGINNQSTGGKTCLVLETEPNAQ